MNTDINERIKWQSGLQLTPATFNHLDENLDRRQLAALRISGGTRFGRLPDSVFCSDGVFVQGTFEVALLECTAVLPDGRLVSPKEPVAVRFPRLDNGYAYLTITIGSDIVEYEREGIPYQRHSYQYEILHQAELMRRCDAMPLVRFLIKDGHCNIDKAYISPCLQLSCDERLGTWLDTLAHSLEQIVHHERMEEGDAKQTLLRYLFRLRSFHPRHTLDDLALLANELVEAVRYFIVQPNHAEDPEVEDVNLYDVEVGLQQVKAYLDAATLVLNDVVLTDNSIDVEALKAQIKEELLNDIRPELLQTMRERFEEMRNQLQQQLNEALRNYVDNTLRPLLQEQLQTELSTTLSRTLYDKLYQALYDALYVPQVEEEDQFMPLI
ncbi:MAG: type VI secretion system baseplate subunit TssK [Bacteroidales bacterium]|nr:type VI secretion system baseplate subunit TssK [Candidatus Physcousia equi]